MQTLRHLVFATDAWVGAIRGEARPYHPWGVPFTGLLEQLDLLGYAGETAVVHLSDHGHYFGDHGLQGKPFADGELVAQGPGAVDAGEDQA